MIPQHPNNLNLWKLNRIIACLQLRKLKKNRLDTPLFDRSVNGLIKRIFHFRMVKSTSFLHQLKITIVLSITTIAAIINLEIIIVNLTLSISKYSQL